MASTDLLETWLGRRTPEELAELIDQHPQVLQTYGSVPRTLRQLAQALVSDHSLSGLLHQVNQPEQEMLTAAVRLTERRASEEGGSGGQRGAVLTHAWWEPRFMAPVERTVSERELLAALCTDDADETDETGDGEGAGARREAALAVLEKLRARLLLHPDKPGWIRLPRIVCQTFGGREHDPRPVEEALTASFNQSTVVEIAKELGLGDGKRAAVQARIVAYLGDAEKVRALLASAPEDARSMVERLASTGGLLGTYCYEYQVLSSGVVRYHFRPGGSGVPSTDWLAHRGLLMPVAPERAELPAEVVRAVRGETRAQRYPFTPEPPRPGTVPVPAERVRAEAQAAASAAAGRLELLLKALAEQPCAVRKSGGVAVRDTRRIARGIGVDEVEARLWIDLCEAAGLVAAEHTGKGTQLLPTTRYDAWLKLPPPDRLAPVIAVWGSLRDVATWWPEDNDETPVALAGAHDYAAPGMRLALVRVLAALPPGTGTAAGDRVEEKAVARFTQLVEAASWYQPLAVRPSWGASAGARVLATLHEAELLGVAAHGALTGVGHALLALLEPTAGTASGAGAFGGPGYSPRAVLRQPGMEELRGALRVLLPPPEERAHFQADMTVVVTGAPSAALTELLGSVADRESEGHAVVWRFTAASVRRALDAGTDAERLVAELAEVAVNGLPQPLEYLVRDTARAHGRVRVVRSACCVRSDDVALVLELSRARSLKKLGLRVIAPTVLISAHSVRATLDALRAAGYSPVLEAETGATVVERVKRHRAPAPREPATRRPTRRGSPVPTAAELAHSLLSAG